MIQPSTKARLPKNADVAWKPIPKSSQALALASSCDVTLFTGPRGPGKTDVQLMKFRKHVGEGYGSFWRGVIFDREYKNLDDLVAKSKRWFHAFNDGAKFLESKADYKWVWPTGEELMFRAIKKPSDYWAYHGQEFPFIGWNELAKYPTLELFDKMFSCNRSSFVPELHSPPGRSLKELPLQVFATTNPFGPGHNAVKTRFITPAPYGVIIKRKLTVFNPRTQQDEEVTKTQVTIFGSWRENIYLSKEYVAELYSIKDPNLRGAWKEGSWDIVAGGALDDVWNARKHVLPRFKVPESWHVDRCLDWGSTQPFSYGVFAEANGEEAILPDGTSFCPPPGSLIQCGEIYGATEIGTNQGVRWGSVRVAEAIIDYEDTLLDQGWISAFVRPGPADNSIRSVSDADTETVEKNMNDVGVNWLSSDKSKGSRKIGLQLVRDRLQAAKINSVDDPHLYFMANCRASTQTLPVLPRDEDDPEDIDTTAEDHAYDMVRYRCLRGANRAATHLKISFVS
jgi:hypothetical protein